MGEITGIQWTDATWNPWQGCHKVSQGCKFCYMFAEKTRYGQAPNVVVRSSPATFFAPMRWTKPQRVFTCSWSDFFIEEADPWRPEAWEIIRRTPHLTYQILTKRQENIADRLPADWGMDYSHVQLGVTVENQDVVEARISELLQIPAAVRFLSCEPLLGPLDLRGWLCKYHPTQIVRPLHIDWVIIGGESGPHARTMREEWARDIVSQCRAADIPVFVKQMGVVWAKANGKHGKAADPAEWPEDLRVREFPGVTA